MSSITGTLEEEKGIAVFIKNHPLAAYFVLAYAGTWIALVPLVMDSIGLFALPDVLGIILFILSSLSGPALAAFWVTGILEGKPGVKRLLRRTFQVRAGWQWYLFALFSFLSIWLAAYSVLYMGAPLINLFSNPSILLSFFLPSVILGLLIPSIGEEPGWRGFALPRLQANYGPVIGTVILGALHGFWHLPALFTPLLGPFTYNGFLTFVLTAIAGSFIYTWIFNNTHSSVWIAMVLHASSNAASQLMGELIPQNVGLPAWVQALESGWLNVIVFSLVALGLTWLTRGRLGYKPEFLAEKK